VGGTAHLIKQIMTQIGILYLFRRIVCPLSPDPPAVTSDVSVMAAIISACHGAAAASSAGSMGAATVCVRARVCVCVYVCACIACVCTKHKDICVHLCVHV